MSNSTYNILVDGEAAGSKSKKAAAIEAADALRADHPEATIEVQTGTGTTVHTVKVKGTHAKPWTRTEVHEGIEVEVPAGYVVAYTRKRVGAVVARNEDKTGWLVLTESGDSLEAKNTVEARELTNALAADYRTKREQAKLDEATKRAEAKVQREADRAEAKRLKEEAKAAKAAAREQAKVDRAEAKRIADEAKATEKAAKDLEASAAAEDAEDGVELASA